jgi:hypothetical protein
VVAAKSVSVRCELGAQWGWSFAFLLAFKDNGLYFRVVCANSKVINEIKTEEAGA